MRLPIFTVLLASLPFVDLRAQSPTSAEARELFAIVDAFAPLDTSKLPLLAVTRRAQHSSYTRHAFLVRSHGRDSEVQYLDLGRQTIRADRLLDMQPVNVQEALEALIVGIERLDTETDGVYHSHYLSPESTMHPHVEALLLARVLDRLDRATERDRLLALASDARNRLAMGLSYRLTIDATDPRYSWQDLLQRHELWLATFPGHDRAGHVEKRRAGIAAVIAQLEDPATSAEKKLLLEDPWLDGNRNFEAGHLTPPVPPPHDGTRPLDRLLQGGSAVAWRMIDLLGDDTPSRSVSYCSRYGGFFTIEPVGALAEEVLREFAGRTAPRIDSDDQRVPAWQVWVATMEEKEAQGGALALLEERLAAGDANALSKLMQSAPERLPQWLQTIDGSGQHAMNLCSRLLELPQTATREDVHAACRAAASRCPVQRWRALMVQRLCELGDRDALALVVASWRQRDPQQLAWRYKDTEDAFEEMKVLVEFADADIWQLLAEQCGHDTVRNRLARAMLALVCERRARRADPPTLSADQLRVVRALLADESFLLEKESVPAGHRHYPLLQLQTAEGAAIWLATTRPGTFTYLLLEQGDARRKALLQVREAISGD